MYSLPTLAPQDSHTLWYSTSAQTQPAPNPSTSNSTTQTRRQHGVPPSQLALLRAAEAQVIARKHNIKNYGNSWIKPPGVAKTLFQRNEEKREAEEHAEAMRRDALAAELAQAELAEQEAQMRMSEDMEGGERDLDEDVPEADVTADFEEEEEEDDDEEEENEEEEEEEEEIIVPQSVLPSRVPEDAYREALMRGSGGLEGALDDEDEGGGDMLQESDLVSTQATYYHPNMDSHLDMDMEADLDEDVPEAEEEYEHTDTDEEISSSEEEASSPAFGMTDLRHPTGIHGHYSAGSMVRSDGTQNSMDMSSPQQFQGRRSGH
ncbi:hypothetical protein BJ878DRAFT_507128 [Calycina marina]|uniref:Apc15p protein-domain-containing protein n=1 Tax=Calycina marina TaxID=1763456 RepID=A0A9P7Z2R5_9HELO|nr:hypothetical protein BJ878DRAFT_507128 [Calycina marina]